MVKHLSVRQCRWAMFATVMCWLAVIVTSAPASAQSDPRRGPPGCVPVSERKMEIGCYILVADMLGELPQQPLYWQIESYPTRAAAEAAKGPHATVVEALDKVWLMAIAEAGWRSPGGTHVAEIGPLVVKPNTKYIAQYMQGVMLPGAQTGVHHHPGPEVLYTIAGEECMETMEGKFVGRPGETPVIVPAEVPHRLTITGVSQRRSLALILHDSTQPGTIQGDHGHGWTPKGLCKIE
jgi:quercetin dioxygenase-like cupin family protein